MYKYLAFFLTLVLISCSGKKVEEYYQEAQTALSVDKYTEAIVIFEEMINEYPESEKSMHAILEIAKIYHLELIKEINSTTSLQKAVFYYKKTNNMFPETDQGRNALFLAGFIEANDLKDFVAAKNSFQQFIEKYPKSEMVESAKIEMQNLGKSPEELLKGIQN